MTQQEFFSVIKSKGARIWGPINQKAIEYTNIHLQQNQFAALPTFMIDFYKQTSGINLGSAYIFGPSELPNGNHIPIPNIIEINKNLSSVLKNQTIFGRNDLFLFSFDSFGICYMLNNTNLKVLKKYDDPIKSLYDCLIIGKL
ncbi:MAG: hypothetical protein ACLRFI_01330 [Alphaproteobacteria bacterium]